MAVPGIPIDKVLRIPAHFYLEMNVEEGAATILRYASSGQPFFIGRNGTIELETIFFWMLKRRVQDGDVLAPYPLRIRDQIQRNAGIFPDTDESIDAWCKAYVDSLGHMNALAAGWYRPLHHIENTILSSYAPTAQRFPLRSLEPYYVEAPLRWTTLLAGKHVAVVSSFAATIQKQLWGEKTAQIWQGEQAGMLPADVEWSYVRTGYAPSLALGNAGWPAHITRWQEAVDATVQAVVDSGATVALIGCGGLGMIVGCELRKKGISCILLGGAIQVLFGIRGSRWKSHDIISKFWNDAWVSPSKAESPNGAFLVEGGCYW